MPDLRASDADRDAAVARLHEHHLAGRLDHDELEDRVEVAQRARTVSELDAVQADLPAPAPPPAPPAPARRVPWWPGVRSFDERHELDVPPRNAHDAILDDIAPALARYGYTVAYDDGETVHFVRHFRPGWAILVAVIGFPIGLLALTVRESDEIVVRVSPHRSARSRLVVYGVAPLAVRKAFATLSE